MCTKPTICSLPNIEDLPLHLQHFLNYLVPLGLVSTSVVLPELESEDYSAYRLMLKEKNYIYRSAKTTPTKIGQFVTLWQRKPEGFIAPFDSSGNINGAIIHVHEKDKSSYFIFDRDTLIKQKIISQAGEGGKRGFRIYPKWTSPIAKAAIASQHWQLASFIDTNNSPDHVIAMRIHQLLGIKG